MMKFDQIGQKLPAFLENLFASFRRYWVTGLVIGLCVAGVMARVAPIAASRFHQDEAIYGYWALQVVTGQDNWLSDYPVDKPPLHIYTLALFMRLFGHSETVARLPGELSSAASIVLIYFLCKHLYGHRTALASLALAAFSPFSILFASTAFTDPMMVTWVLGSLLAAVHHRWGWTGWLLGLGVITKPQAVLFLPLVVAVGMVSTGESTRTDRPGKAGRSLARFAIGLALAILPAIAWDALRSQHMGFFRQSIVSYGGFRWAPVGSWLERLQEWGQLLGYFTGSRLLNAILLIGLPILLGYALFRWRAERNRVQDWLFALFVTGFILLHTVLEINVWDRYLLGLVPFVLLLLARVLTLPADLCQTSKTRQIFYNTGVAILLFATLFRPVQDATSSRYPIGGTHGAYNGLDALVNYVRGNVPGEAVIYHQWLGWHYSFYLFDFPYLFQWYTTPHELAQDALGRQGVPRYVAFPSWYSATAYRWTLKHTGLNMSPIYETYRDNGTRSFTLYRIEEMTPDD